jgi:uncharacterized protein
MKDAIAETYYRLLEDVETDTHRYLFDTLDVHRHRLVGIIGARGTGKTTLMLQYINEKIDDVDTALYFSADHILFSSVSLVGFVREQYELAGRNTFFIDEIHKYPRWNQELKNIYDSFPKIRVLFSGSSSISLTKGSYDLSRRALLHKLKGLSFREFLQFDQNVSIPVYSFEAITASHPKIARKVSAVPGIRGLFKEYLASGYYPFYFEDKPSYTERLLSVIEKTVYEDVASHYKLNTAYLPVLKKLLLFYATSQPGELSINRLSKSLGIDNKTVASYLEMLESTDLLMKIAIKKSGGAAIRKPQKIFLGNPNLYHAICRETGHDAQIGTVRENFVLSMLLSTKQQAFYTSQGDYIYSGITLEIGGKNKGTKQIKHLESDAFVVRDDVLISSNNNAIPLYLFGFLY